MPLTEDPGKNIAELTKAHPEWSHKRQIAAGFNAAREHGGEVPAAKKKQAAQYRALRD